MIEKPCALSWRIIKLYTLKRRYPLNFPKWPDIATELVNRILGYQGEKSLDFYLDQLSTTKYTIFHDIRLFDGKYYFQIDILILCKRFALILESKNRGGEIVFERDINQTTIKKHNKRKRIANPILQAQLQAIKLKKWLREHNCAELPIRYLFVNCKEETLITMEHNYEHAHHICNSEGLIEKIGDIASEYKDDSIDTKEFRKIKRLILTNHTPDNPDILQQFNIPSKEILTGVFCPFCGFLPVNYHYGKWRCTNCKKTSKDAHVPAIYDHFLLIKPTITNSELRQLLHIQSIKVANKILNSMNLPYTGVNKGRVYEQPPMEEFHTILCDLIKSEEEKEKKLSPPHA